MVRITPIQRGFRWYATAWSPDSSRLALGRIAIPPSTKPGQEIPPTPGSLWVTVGAIATTHLQRLPLPPSFRGQPGWPDVVFWSPDGRFLTVGVGPDIPCNSCRTDGLPYYAIPVAGGQGVPLGTALAPGEAISWAPDGSYVVLSSPLGRFTYLDKHLFRVNPTTGAQRALSHDWRRADTEPAVSPNGKHIAFARGRAGPSTRLTPVELIASRHVYLMDADGGQPHQLTNAPGWTDEAPVWSPDGQWLFFVRWRRHHQAAETALWAVRADGTNPQRIAHLDVPVGQGLFDVASQCKIMRLVVQSSVAEGTTPRGAPKPAAEYPGMPLGPVSVEKGEGLGGGERPEGLAYDHGTPSDLALQ